MIPLWARPNWVVTTHVARTVLVVISNRPLPEPLPVSRSRHGIPAAEGAAHVDVAVHHRAESPDWFATCWTTWAAVAEEDLAPAEASAIAAAPHAYIVNADSPDADNMSALQTAWAIAKCACEAGGGWVIDVAAARIHRGIDVAALSPTREFSLDAEVTVMVHDGTPAFIVLRGLSKFARPDMVVGPLDPANVAHVAYALRTLAHELAGGALLEPGDALVLGESDYAVQTTGDANQFGLTADALWLAPT